MELVLNKFNTTKEYDAIYLFVAYLCICSLASDHLSMANVIGGNVMFRGPLLN